MRVLFAAALMLLPVASFAADKPAPLGSGHWEGTIQVQKTSVAVTVDLAQNQSGEWTGTLALPGQNLSEVAVSKLSVNDGSVYFESRESLFAVEAKLSPDGKSLQGDFQSGFLLAVPVPIRLQRVSEPHLQAAAARSSLTGDLVGTWEGTLKFGASWEADDSRAGSEMNVRVTLTTGGDGVPQGRFQKPGSRDPELPLSAIEQKPGSVRFEVRGAGVSFTADLKDHELAGEWRQFDLDPVPLKLRRVAGARSNP